MPNRIHTLLKPPSTLWVLLLGFALPMASFEGPLGLIRTQSETQSLNQGHAQRQPPSKSAEEEQPRPGSADVISQPSLGELARQQRAERAKDSKPPAHVFTNDNLPKSSGGLSVVGPAPGSENAASSTPEGTHVAARLRRRIADLQQQLDTHQRELAVLQQKLGQNAVQYYPNPNDILHQEYSREDINRITSAIDQKKQQIDADQQALAGAQDELARQGLVSDAPEAGQESSSSKPDLSGVKKGSEEYWRLRFQAAREALAKTQEQEKLAEDELSLLQSQQAHEVASGGAAVFDSPIAAKQAEVEAKRAAVTQARNDLDSLEQEFKQSGAPQSWSDQSSG